MKKELDNDIVENFLQGDEFDTDLELFEMRKQYNEMKRERLASAKNVQVMENKIKLLESEETNIKSRLDKQLVNQSQKVKKMAELSSAKEELIKAKMLQQKENKLKAEKLQQIREQIRFTLKSYHTKVAEKNQLEAQKQKQIKEEVLELKKEQLNEIFEKNKMNQTIVRSQLKEFSEKKKQDELLRKQKMKEELARKMKEEAKLKEELEEKMNRCEIKESQLIEKISTTKQSILKKNI